MWLIYYSKDTTSPFQFYWLFFVFIVDVVVDDDDDAAIYLTKANYRRIYSRSQLEDTVHQRKCGSRSGRKLFTYALKKQRGTLVLSSGFPSLSV